MQLDERTVPREPFSLFDAWYGQALKETRDPANAFILSTNIDGKPSSRVLLLKDWSCEGFVFYTNMQSRKGYELEKNPSVAMLFYWPEFARQIRIEGTVRPISEEEARAYFATRPRGSQIGAHASQQSAVIESRMYLDQKMKDLEALYHDSEVPKPDHWGGFRVIPEMFEFWQGQDARLHDRVRYTHAPDGRSWRIERLAP